jgi:hypothetical protein
MKRYFLYLAADLMIFVGIFRGIGGVSLLLKGASVKTDVSISATGSQTLLVGIGLVVVLFFMIAAGVLLMKHRSYKWWIMSWIATVFFLIDGLINGFILFGAPSFQGQVINIVAALLIFISLVIGKKELTIHE